MPKKICKKMDNTGSVWVNGLIMTMLILAGFVFVATTLATPESNKDVADVSTEGEETSQMKETNTPESVGDFVMFPVEIVELEADYDHQVLLHFDFEGEHESVNVSVEKNGSNETSVIGPVWDLPVFGSSHSNLGKLATVYVHTRDSFCVVPYIYVYDTQVKIYPDTIDANERSYCLVENIDPNTTQFKFEDCFGQDYVDFDYNDVVIEIGLYIETNSEDNDTDDGTGDGESEEQDDNDDGTGCGDEEEVDDDQDDNEGGTGCEDDEDDGEEDDDQDGDDGDHGGSTQGPNNGHTIVYNKTIEIVGVNGYSNTDENGTQSTGYIDYREEMFHDDGSDVYMHATVTEGSIATWFFFQANWSGSSFPIEVTLSLNESRAKNVDYIIYFKVWTGSYSLVIEDGELPNDVTLTFRVEPSSHENVYVEYALYDTFGDSVIISFDETYTIVI